MTHGASGPVRRPPLAVSVSASRGSRVGAGLASWLVSAAPRKARGTVAIALLSDRRMRQLNDQFRGVDEATDVLSFPAGSSPGSPGKADHRAGTGRLPQPRELGDVAIALGVARRQAKEQGHALAIELRVLALHGLLHLLGYDHERDDGEMRRFEERLRRQAGLPLGLIARAPHSRAGRRTTLA